MKQLKIFGVPVASFGEADARTANKLQYGSLPDDAVVPGRATKFLSPRYEPSNITQNANVQAVQEAIRMAENGQTQELFRFYRDVLLSDDHIQSCFNTRKLALLAQTLSILPEDKNNAADIALAKALGQAKSDCENWTAGMLALMDCGVVSSIALTVFSKNTAGCARSTTISGGRGTSEPHAE